MERGKPKKIWLSSNGQTPPSVCGLPFVSLVPLQMAVVKLQRLYHKIGFLPSGYRLRYELGYPFITESGLFFLVRLFLLHDALDNLVCELPVLVKLFHLDSLCKRRGSVVVAHGFKQGILLFLGQIRDLNRRAESNLPVVNHLQDFGYKLGQTDIAENLVFTFAYFFGKFI